MVGKPSLRVIRSDRPQIGPSMFARKWPSSRLTVLRSTLRVKPVVLSRHCSGPPSSCCSTVVGPVSLFASFLFSALGEAVDSGSEAVDAFSVADKPGASRTCERIAELSGLDESVDFAETAGPDASVDCAEPEGPDEP